jgi:hypothetical protein
LPLQHDDAVVQTAPSAPHAPVDPHRRTPRLDGWAEQGPAQHSLAFKHDSPPPPQPLGATHRDAPVPSATHCPLQQSLLDEHTSHAGRQPPMGAHLRTPLVPAMQRREQQSSSFAQTSSTRRVHALPSVLVHVRFELHRATPSVPDTQLAEQQSAPVAQSSPLGWQPVNAAHRRAPLTVSHTWPQQSESAPQPSPAGRQAVPSTDASTRAESTEPPSGPSRMVSDTPSQPVSRSAAVRR